MSEAGERQLDPAVHPAALDRRRQQVVEHRVADGDQVVQGVVTLPARRSASSAAYTSRSTGSGTASPVCVESTIAFASSSDQSASRAGARGGEPVRIAAAKSACTSRWSPLPRRQCDLLAHELRLVEHRRSRRSGAPRPAARTARRRATRRRSRSGRGRRRARCAARPAPSSTPPACRARRSRTRAAPSPCPRPPSAAPAAATPPTPSPAEPARWQSRSSVCGAWFISTPPPSPSHVPRQPAVRVVAVRAVERVDDRHAHELAEPAARRSAHAQRRSPAGSAAGSRRRAAGPSRSAAAIIASASRASTASGFSTSTCAPASSDSIVSAGWDGCGVQTTTTSGASASSSR